MKNNSRNSKGKSSGSIDQQTLRSLMEDAQRYKALFDSSLFCVYLLDFEGNILDANDAALNLLGYTRKDIPLYTITSLVGEDQSPVAFHIIEGIKQKGAQRSPVALRVKKKDGGHVWLEVEGTLLNRDGNPHAILGIGQNVTAYKAAEHILRESENRYRSIFENTGTAIFIVEEDTTISIMNKECENLTGFSKEEVEGKKSWTEFVVKEDLERLREYHRVRRNEPARVPRTYETRMIHHYGNVRDIVVTTTLIPETKQSVVSLLDITEQRAAERSLEESEAKFRAFVEKIPNTVVYMAALDEKSTTLYVSPQISQILGYTQEEYKDNADLWAQRVHPDDHARVMAELEHCRRTGKPFVSQYRMLRKDNKTIWFHDEAHIIRDKDGTPLFLLGTNTDITGRKLAEDNLRERERDLEIKTKNLEEINVALNVLLQKREADKAELEEKILFNIKQMVEPYLAKLRQSGLDERQKALAGILESNLKDITSSFAFSLSSRHLNLTPKEVKVANLIKQGRTSKEICEILGSSEKVVAFHRQNIRRKLGLLNKKVNLKSYLMAKT